MTALPRGRGSRQDARRSRRERKGKAQAGHGGSFRERVLARTTGRSFYSTTDRAMLSSHAHPLLVFRRPLEPSPSPAPGEAPGSAAGGRTAAGVTARSSAPPPTSPPWTASTGCRSPPSPSTSAFRRAASSPTSARRRNSSSRRSARRGDLPAGRRRPGVRGPEGVHARSSRGSSITSGVARSPAGASSRPSPPSSTGGPGSSATASRSFSGSGSRFS